MNKCLGNMILFLFAVPPIDKQKAGINTGGKNLGALRDYYVVPTFFLAFSSFVPL